MGDHIGYRDPAAPSRPPSWFTWRRAAGLAALTMLLCAAVSLTGRPERRRLVELNSLSLPGPGSNTFQKLGSNWKTWKTRTFQFQKKWEQLDNGGIRIYIRMDYYDPNN